MEAEAKKYMISPEVRNALDVLSESVHMDIRSDFRAALSSVIKGSYGQGYVEGSGVMMDLAGPAEE